MRRPDGMILLRPWLLLCWAVLILSGCGSEPLRPQQGDAGTRERALDAALGQLGRPYRYGGADSAGFDCSGLVYFSYRAAGLSLPRSARDQMHSGLEIDPEDVRPGDLLFFRFPGNQANGVHVVMWLGGGRAIHAPSGTGEVEVIHIDVPWWMRRFETAVAVAP